MSRSIMSNRLVRLPNALVVTLFAGLLAAAGAASAADEADASKLPVKRVVLFNSGVGFFEHLGEVDDDDKVDLQFRIDDINDLLKSMVLQDLGGGKISTISYGSRDPITKTLKTFAVDLTTNPTMSELLGQLRGEKVEVQSTNAVAGTILGVESRQQRVGEDEKGTVNVSYLNLLTADGLQSVALPEIRRIKLVNPQIDAELREALKILAMSHDTDKKTVTLNFLGQGKRPVRVGYIQESPVWKTSYRLVLDDEEPPFLQGWAIVENTTEADWKDVALTLVSGRPISLIMDLYSPLYAARPVVEPELYASLRPQTYDQDLASRDREFRKAADKGRGEANEKAGAALAAAPGAPPAADGRQLRRENSKKDASGLAEREQMDLKHGVKSLAEAQDVGELFQYAIGTPVSLQRQRSAMLPIVNDSIKGNKLSIYNPAVHPKHPLNGLKLTNSSGLHLMQGPVTVFDGGIYAGDARFPDLPPGTERLVSYAMDLDTEVAPTTSNRPEELVNVRLVKGTLYTSRKFTREQKYVIKNSGKKAKNVLIEYPIDPNWSLVTPKEPTERARDLYRFAVEAKPGEPTELKIEEQMIQNQQFAVTNLDDGTIAFYINAKVVSEPVKVALREVIKRKAAINQLVTQRQQLEQQVAVIGQEQERIRKNMAELPKNSDLFTRYIKKFTDQEDEIEKLRKQIADLMAKEVEQRKGLDAYLLGLELN